MLSPDKSAAQQQTAACSPRIDRGAVTVPSAASTIFQSKNQVQGLIVAHYLQKDQAQRGLQGRSAGAGGMMAAAKRGGFVAPG